MRREREAWRSTVGIVSELGRSDALRHSQLTSPKGEASDRYDLASPHPLSPMHAAVLLCPSMSEPKRKRAKGGGRKAMPAEMKRPHRLPIHLTSAQVADLDAIAVAWRVPRGLAAYALVVEALTRARNVSTSDPHSLGIGFVAALGVVQAAGFHVAPCERLLEPKMAVNG